MRNLMSTFALLSVLALPALAHADTFDFTATGAGGGFSGTGTFTASANGGGSYTITGISGTDIIGLVAPGLFDNNDNLLFPASASLVDSQGFAFTANQGDTDFTVDIFAASTGVYDAYFLDSDGVTATIPVTFALTSATVPEPDTLVLLATGMIAAAGMAWRRLSAA